MNSVPPLYVCDEDRPLVVKARPGARLSYWSAKMSWPGSNLFLVSEPGGSLSEW